MATLETRTARKQYECSAGCGRPINSGDTYTKHFTTPPGFFHPECVDLKPSDFSQKSSLKADNVQEHVPPVRVKLTPKIDTPDGFLPVHTLIRYYDHSDSNGVHYGVHFGRILGYDGKKYIVQCPKFPNPTTIKLPVHEVEPVTDVSRKRVQLLS